MCLAGACVAPTTCESDKVCLALGGVCDAQLTKRCVECLSDGDCDAGTCEGGRCSASRVACASSKACAQLNGVCDGKKGYCVDCVTKSDCGQGDICVAGSCVAPICIGGESSCAPGKPSRLVCSATGDKVDEIACAAGESCKAGKCVPGGSPSCTPGAKSCKGQDVWVCQADGKASVKLAACPSATTCDKGACVGGSGTCKAGAKKCSATKLLTCDAGGNWLATDCVDGSACTTDSCAAGACSFKPVADGTTCVGGTCAAGVCKLQCTPGTFVGKHTVLMKSTDGTVYMTSNAKRLVVAHKNPIATKTLQYVAFDWSGKKLWEAVPSTTGTQSSPVMKLLSDGTLLSFQRELDVNGGAYSTRMFIMSPDGKLLESAVLPKSKAEIRPNVTSIVQTGAGKWLVIGWLYSKVSGSNLYGYFTVTVDQKLKPTGYQEIYGSSKYEYKQVSNAFAVPNDGYWAVLFERKLVSSKVVTRSSLVPLLGDGKLDVAPAGAFPQDMSYVSVRPAPTAKGMVCVMSTRTDKGPTVQSVIRWAGKSGWVAGAKLPDAVYGKLIFARGPSWVEPGGTALLGVRYLAVSKNYQPVILRIKDDGTVKEQVGFPAGDWRVGGVAPPSGGTVIALTRAFVPGASTAIIGLQRLCAQ